MVRFGFDGASFHGWPRQPGRRTVEGELRRGLVRVGVAPSVEAAGLEVASRTDRGVSARANALALSSDLRGSTLLERLNRIDPEMFFMAAAKVTPEFRVRRALRRTYRYFDAKSPANLSARRAAAAVLRGPIDVRSLGRELPIGQPTWREIDSVEVRPEPGGTVIEVRARSFVWGMVRKIVAAIRQVEDGRLSVDRLRRAAAGEVRLTLPMAEAEPLVLWEIEYEHVEWEVRWPGASRWQRQLREGELGRSWARTRVLASLDWGEL